MEALSCYHACMSKQLTLRGVPDEVARQLEKVSHESGQSVNAVVNDILADAVGEQGRRRRLERYATWTPEDQAEFEQALQAQRQVDQAMWR